MAGGGKRNCMSSIAPMFSPGSLLDIFSSGVPCPFLKVLPVQIWCFDKERPRPPPCTDPCKGKLPHERLPHLRDASFFISDHYVVESHCSSFTNCIRRSNEPSLRCQRISERAVSYRGRGTRRRLLVLTLSVVCSTSPTKGFLMLARVVKLLDN